MPCPVFYCQLLLLPYRMMKKRQMTFEMRLASVKSVNIILSPKVIFLRSQLRPYTGEYGSLKTLAYFFAVDTDGLHFRKHQDLDLFIYKTILCYINKNAKIFCNPYYLKNWRIMKHKHCLKKEKERQQALCKK